ncbi:MAG: alkyl sulfatase C-terminal domain-containing protein [Thermodesulfobacteriota bacterium]|nr:alkyl sulfatase C-terminal domain-containing protein [Thermodesulfobacteriota bacterium]
MRLFASHSVEFKNCGFQSSEADFLGIRLDSKKAEGIEFVINLSTPENGEKYIVELSNSTLTNIKGVQAYNADLSIVINRSDLEQTMMGVVSFEEQIKSGKAKLSGDRKPYDQLKNMLVQSDIGFEILPGTCAPIWLQKRKLLRWKRHLYGR